MRQSEHRTFYFMISRRHWQVNGKTIVAALWKSRLVIRWARKGAATRKRTEALSPKRAASSKNHDECDAKANFQSNMVVHTASLSPHCHANGQNIPSLLQKCFPFFLECYDARSWRGPAEELAGVINLYSLNGAEELIHHYEYIII